MSLMRKKGFLVVHTREGHRPDLADLPANKHGGRGRSGRASAIQDPAEKSWCAGENGWEIIPELAAIEGELLLDKPGKG